LGGQRSCDVIGRWGGEEFLVILPDIEPTALGDMAERCRVMISQSWVTAGNAPIRVTASIGATVLSDGETVEAALRRVDGLMCESKRSGGNQTTAG
jgi:diguanylate cyclase (GGDEF)-like protein